MRWVVLDTETTGSDPRQGHRIIEVGCVELIERRRTGRHFQAYLNPDRDSEEGALQVHGLTREFLADKPRFEEVAERLVAFLGEAEIIIHNAPFDLGFLDAEFARLDPAAPPFSSTLSVTDSLRVAREKHPGQPNSLNALCRRYGVDSSGRTLHGALLDAELLADVYLALTAGQSALDLALEDTGVLPQLALGELALPTRVIEPSARELAHFEARLQQLTRIAAGRQLHPLWQGLLPESKAAESD